ncbi:hypothetical protein [Corallococcus silvisoli]|uniref:hypothetical protein n=1 Tax=Corallococcus silvisoli TaxID=2697031 RepID=UPI001376E6BD|nr:hypothetical protein [Corallococcus silvisoli]NBD11851.1 hypothetical protein [Corallococcus silvisoli]
MADHLEPQPPPVANDKPAVWDLVVQDLERDEARGGARGIPLTPWSMPAIWRLVQKDARARDTQGRARYGVPLQPHNGRDALVDAYQEALDLAVYLRQALEERRAATFVPDRELYVVEHLVLLYDHARATVRHLRWLLLARDGK